MSRAARVIRHAGKLARLLSAPAYRRALRHGVAAAVEHEHTSLPRRLSTILDVGANRGQFAVLAANRWPAARLVCFEPLPEPLGALQRVMRHHPRFRCVEVALSDSTGATQLHVSRADDSSSILPISERQVAAFPGTDEVRTLEVRTARLDEEVPPGTIERPALLKIDVQGAELDVLRGAIRLLPELDSLLVECSFSEFYTGQPLIDDVIRFLHKQGFVLTAMAASAIDRRGAVLQADLVFMPSSPEV